MRKMKLDDLAELVGVTSGFMGLVERGDRGMVTDKLIKIADAFELTLDDLLKDKNSADRTDNGAVAYDSQKALITLTSNLETVEIDYIISVVKGFKKVRG
ncbi:hypothetical protein FACS1894188_01780 [Clostridia bacterium]|nr:hypothetical protein FACS1894188_01780 [Clostridia bacterium]